MGGINILDLDVCDLGPLPLVVFFLGWLLSLNVLHGLAQRTRSGTVHFRRFQLLIRAWPTAQDVAAAVFRRLLDL
jgi:hypothetical protein